MDTLDFCWLALFLALSAKTCFYEQNSHPEKNNSGHHTAVQLGQFCGEMFSSEENDLGVEETVQNPVLFSGRLRGKSGPLHVLEMYEGSWHAKVTGLQKCQKN